MESTHRRQQCIMLRSVTIKAGGFNGYSKQPRTTVKIDTTCDIAMPAGSIYTFRTNCDQTPTVTVGTVDIVVLIRCRRETDADYWHIVFVGKPGGSAGIYTAGPREEPLKRFVARVI